MLNSEFGLSPAAEGEGGAAFGEFMQCFLGGVQGIEGEVELLAVVAGHEHVADFHGGVAFLREVIDGVEVAEGLGHLAAVDHEVGDVEPVGGEVATTSSSGTGRFRFRGGGKTRSTPPEWRSKSVPRYSLIIAEHSRCQPGRPSPQGEVQ